ncbi:hypothetical protein PEC18_38130 [Paucibacter sp. O1-1]|nr:hypothetical protein [Paucibacter sp. O1-1]MDA3831442.1 hypothetical protein [Paucibacter sp. O1-1]
MQITNEIGLIEKLLENKSVEEIVSEMKKSFQDVQQKKSAGQSVFQQLTESLQHNKDRLTFIDAGLLPPAFKFDDTELLKEQINQCRRATIDLDIAGDATTGLFKLDLVR